MGRLAAAGVASIICNRPDNEEPGQPAIGDMEAMARQLGMQFVAIPYDEGDPPPNVVGAFAEALQKLPRPIVAYCRSGRRPAVLLKTAAEFSSVGTDAAHKSKLRDPNYDVVILGGGAAGIACAASIRNRNSALTICIVDPSEDHFYQPGWTLVGAGVMAAERTRRDTSSIIPPRCDWVRGMATGFDPDCNFIRLGSGRRIEYRALVIAPGIFLDWSAIDGLEAALGRNGVTSNYRFDLAPYTWKLTQNLRGGVALFTQPPLPIKCAGAPQKAMYLSCDHWRRRGVLHDIDVAFHTAAPTLFGVGAYVPALEKAAKGYGANLHFASRLIAVDGERRVATFRDVNGETSVHFDMLHVCPPQRSLPLVAESELADEGGFLDVDPATLTHKRYANVFGAGDACGTGNAKTAAAARKQAPVVAENLIAYLEGRRQQAEYSGYGSCPLTVARGKVVLAEFGYGGVLQPTFPAWFLDGQRPQSIAWFLKARAMPWIYWQLMLKGREWLAAPRTEAQP